MIPLLLLACAGSGADTAAPPQGPSLAHSPPAEGLVEGDDLVLSATAEDPDGVAAVVVYHRVSGAEYWQALELGEADGTWSGTIEGVQAPGLEYYLRAQDRGAPPATSTLPAAGADGPFVLGVGVLAAGLPWSEDFEDTTADDLDDLDWWTPSLGFAGGGFRLTDEQAHGGSRSAMHLRGTASAGELDDWLVSPALDLSSLDAAMVTWWERGANAAAADHGLWLSVGERDPAAGDYQLVAALDPAPEGAWGQAAVDLSAWADQPVAWLAWRTVGTEADDWWLDEVEVGALAPHLVDPALTWDPDPVSPGETAALTLTVHNAVDLAAEGVVATLSLPEGGGSLAADTVELGAIGGLSEGSATWSLTVDPAWPEHSYLPLEVALTDGSRTWAWELAMVVGLPSTATVGLTTEQAGTVALDLGVGDPDDPLLSFEAHSGWLEAGSHVLSVDLTPYPEWLPPVAGADTRWFARLVASADGTVDSFTIEHAGLLHEATYTPELDAGLPATAQVPSLAEPELSSIEPASVAPGDSDMALTLRLTNAGAESAGPVTVTLASDDPDATVTDGGPYSLTSSAWSRYDARTLSGPLLSVSAEHRDSSPVQLSLSVTDGVDSWVVPVAVAVPWPLPRVASVVIDDEPGDSGGTEGDGDGLLDAGETVLLSVSVANGGGLDTPGEVSASLSVSAGDAEVRSGDLVLGTLSAGEAATGTWTVAVGEGEGEGEGETLSLSLALDDGTSTWTLPVELTLGEAPWLLLAATDDAGDDALDGYPFDLVNARWRVVEDRFELLVQSSTAFDPDDVFVELWGRSSGSSYSYFRWIVQPGGTSMEGYVSGSGFRHIGSLDASSPDGSALLLSWSLSDMDLVTDAFSLGLAAGWCGPPEYYCDHLPDAWGYPYDSFSSGLWLPVAW